MTNGLGINSQMWVSILEKRSPSRSHSNRLYHRAKTSLVLIGNRLALHSGRNWHKKKKLYPFAMWKLNLPLKDNLINYGSFVICLLPICSSSCNAIIMERRFSLKKGHMLNQNCGCYCTCSISSVMSGRCTSYLCLQVLKYFTTEIWGFFCCSTFFLSMPFLRI